MKSSRTRFLLAFLAAELVLAFVSLPRMHLRNERTWMAHTDQLLRDKAVILARSVSATDMNLSSENEMELQTQVHHLFWQLFDRQGRLLRQGARRLDNLSLPDAVRTNSPPASIPSLHTIRHPTLGRLRAAVCPVRIPGPDASNIHAFAQVILPLAEHEKQAAWRLANIALGATIFCLLSVGAVAWLSSRWLTSLRAIAESARQLGQQDLPRQRLPVPEKEPELAEFAQVCNQMLDRIETAYATRQQFIADAAHELRTPLTILRGEIDVTLRRERDPERYRQVLNSNREEIERLSRLLDSLLLLARADAGKAVMASEPVRLAPLCREVVNRRKALADQQHIQLECAGDDAVTVTGDSIALEHIVSNLVDNALRHTPAGERVSVQVNSEKDGARIVVSDTGRGIPAEALPNLFKRFYRVETARTAKQSGAGLGLAIVQALAQAHCGRVTVESRLGQGSVFTVWLPSDGGRHARAAAPGKDG
ncbi:MAG: ATP-binding protein [Verrucomicrobiales bacterium]|nr:ATP-binding protein [Verrucomicrobiales bacterium]